MILRPSPQYVVRFGDPDPTEKKHYVQKIQQHGRDPYAMTGNTSDIDKARRFTYNVAASVAQRCNGWVVSLPMKKAIP